LTGNNRKTGSFYEDKAASYLETQGYRILERNYRDRNGEIDLIAEDGSALVFVEVKYRSTAINGEPAEAVTIRKRRTICRRALCYLREKRLSADCPIRFDVIGFYGNGTFKHYRNAFDFC